MNKYWEDTETETGRPFDLEKHDKEISDKWLNKIKQAREKIEEEVFESLDDDGSDWFAADKVSECMAILDKLIESEEKEDKDGRCRVSN